MPILATYTALDFYKHKAGLEKGIYAVEEHDGETSYCELFGKDKEKWYDERELAERNEELRHELNFDVRDRSEWDSLYDNPGDDRYHDPRSDDDCGGCMVCHDCCDGMGDDCSARTLNYVPAAPEKTLGELLREHLDTKDETVN